MKPLIISFTLSFIFLCMCLEIFLYARFQRQASSITKRRKKRDLLLESSDLETRSPIRNSKKRK